MLGYPVVSKSFFLINCVRAYTVRSEGMKPKQHRLRRIFKRKDPDGQRKLAKEAGKEARKFQNDLTRTGLFCTRWAEEKKPILLAQSVGAHVQFVKRNLIDTDIESV